MGDMPRRPRYLPQAAWPNDGVVINVPGTLQFIFTIEFIRLSNNLVLMQIVGKNIARRKNKPGPG